jgi:hypothetical protein
MVTNHPLRAIAFESLQGACFSEGYGLQPVYKVPQSHRGPSPLWENIANVSAAGVCRKLPLSGAQSKQSKGNAAPDP